MKIKKSLVVGGVALTTAALLFSGTFAWVSSVQEATNRFLMEDYNVALHDVLDGTPVDNGGSHQVEWVAGTEVNKDIWVSNEGSDNILVRVKLIENMRIRKGTEEKLNVENVVHGSAEDVLHDYVTWTNGAAVKTYDEWKELSKEEQSGEYWVLADDGYAYWMKPLAPSGDEDAVGAVGNTALLLDGVTLNEGQEGAIEYSIKVEMDAIDAQLAGLNEEGTTWTGETAKAMATAAVYDPIQEEINRIQEDIANPPTDKEAHVSAYLAQKQKALDAYKAAQSATDPEEKEAYLYEAKWRDLRGESEIVGGDYVKSPGSGAQFIMRVDDRQPGTGVVDEACTGTIVMYYSKDLPNARITDLSNPSVWQHTDYVDGVLREYTVTGIEAGAMKNVTAKNLMLEKWKAHPELLNEHTYDGLTTTYVIVGYKVAVGQEFLDDFKAGKYGVLANEVPEENYKYWK